MTPKEVARFWDRVTIDPGGCWTWDKPYRDGYGRATVSGRQPLAHRVAYEQMVGPIPDGMQLDHLCHTRELSCPGGPCAHRACVNPDHLEPVTQAENKARGRAGQHRANGDRCLRGHRDWQVSATGRRTCRTCRDERVARWAEANAAHIAEYRAANREQKRAYNHEYHTKNREQRIAYMAERRAARKAA